MSRVPAPVLLARLDVTLETAKLQAQYAGAPSVVLVLERAQKQLDEIREVVS